MTIQTQPWVSPAFLSLSGEFSDVNFSPMGIRNDSHFHTEKRRTRLHFLLKEDTTGACAQAELSQIPPNANREGYLYGKKVFSPLNRERNSYHVGNILSSCRYCTHQSLLVSERFCWRGIPSHIPRDNVLWSRGCSGQCLPVCSPQQNHGEKQQQGFS